MNGRVVKTFRRKASVRLRNLWTDAFSMPFFIVNYILFLQYLVGGKFNSLYLTKNLHGVQKNGELL